MSLVPPSFKKHCTKEGSTSVHDEECISRNAHIGFYSIRFEPSLGIADVVCSYRSVTLGRSQTKCADDLAPKFIGLGVNKKISRKYAKIRWNKSSACFEVIVLNKRGIYSHSEWYEQDDILSLSMTEPTPLQMGTIKMYFMPAKTAHI